MNEFKIVNSTMTTSIIRLSILLRITIIMHRSRTYDMVPELKASVEKHKIDLAFPQAWLSNHPLTLVDLDNEKSYLKAADIKSSFSEANEHTALTTNA